MRLRDRRNGTENKSSEIKPAAVSPSLGSDQAAKENKVLRSRRLGRDQTI
jgi:hypothetical protein